MYRLERFNVVVETDSITMRDDYISEGYRLVEEQEVEKKPAKRGRKKATDEVEVDEDGVGEEI